MSILEEYAGADALTENIGNIILINVCIEHAMYGDYFVGNPRHTNYIEKPAQEREWTIID